MIDSGVIAARATSDPADGGVGEESINNGVPGRTPQRQDQQHPPDCQHGH